MLDLQVNDRLIVNGEEYRVSDIARYKGKVGKTIAMMLTETAECHRAAWNNGILSGDTLIFSNVPCTQPARPRASHGYFTDNERPKTNWLIIFAEDDAKSVIVAEATKEGE